MYLPLHNVSDRKYFIRIPITTLGLCTVFLPLFAFIICVLMTIYKDFEKANNTHCKVPNVFPSISASIGNYEPQRTIWKTAIFIHAPLRFFIIYLRWEYYRSIISKNCIIIVKLAVFLNVIENLSLLGLTQWTSSVNYPYHEACFKTFIGTSIFYMFFTNMMLTKYRRRPIVSNLELYSAKLKWRAFFVNVGSFAFAAYFFLRHNKLCEPYGDTPATKHQSIMCYQLLYFVLFTLTNWKSKLKCNVHSTVSPSMNGGSLPVYSMFGFSEYIVVVSNMLFHMTTIYDLKVQYIYFSRKGLAIE